MRHSIEVFLLLPPLLFALDYIWLGIFASELYRKELGPFLRMSGTVLANLEKLERGRITIAEDDQARLEKPQGAIGLERGRTAAKATVHRREH